MKRTRKNRHPNYSEAAFDANTHIIGFGCAKRCHSFEIQIFSFFSMFCLNVSIVVQAHTSHPFENRTMFNKCQNFSHLLTSCVENYFAFFLHQRALSAQGVRRKQTSTASRSNQFACLGKKLALHTRYLFHLLFSLSFTYFAFLQSLRQLLQSHFHRDWRVTLVLLCTACVRQQSHM